MSGIGAGELNQQIELLQKTAGRDSIGGETVAFQSTATVWAKAEPFRGRDYVALQQTQSDLAVRFTIRYRSDVASDWRVRWRHRDYEIDGEPIDVGARREWLELMCRSAQT